jgi:DNA polymerase-3 subunit delta
MRPPTASNAQPFVVWVDGDDPTLIAEAVSGVVDEFVGAENRELIVEDHRGEEVDLPTVADSCATAPFLADRRVVIVRDVGRFSTDDVAPLLTYLKDPLPSTVLVLAGGGGTIAPRLAAAAKAGGRVISTRVAPRDAHDWLRGRLRGASVRLDGDAENLIEAHLGQDINRVGALLEVLSAAYGAGARLSSADVEAYLGEAGSVAPWDLTDAIDRGRTEEALGALHRLLGGGERHPLVVLAILHRHVQSLLRVDDPVIQTESQAAAAMGITKGRSTYPARKALASARRWGSARIGQAIALIADAELDLKGASGCPEDVILDVLVARLCRFGRAAAGVGTGQPARR